MSQAKGPNALGEALRLAQHFGRWRWFALPAVLLGTAAALAETLSVGLAVMLLFALLQESDRIAQAEGPLADLYSSLSAVFGDSPPLIATVFFGLILCNAALSYSTHAMMGALSNRVAEGMRDLVHRAYVLAPYQEIQRQDQGALVHTLANESWSVSEAFVYLWRMSICLCAVVVFAVGLLALSWKITLVTAVGLVFSAVTVRLLSRPVHRLSDETLRANQKLAQRMMISLSGMRTLRVFGEESAVLSRFGQASSALRRIATRMELVRALSGPVSQVLSVGVLILIALTAERMGITLPIVITAALLLLRLQPYLLELEANRLGLAGLAAALADVRQTLDQKPQDTARFVPDSIAVSLRQDIVLDAVSYTHPKGGSAGVHGLSCRFRSGETTLLSGPSGVGKTTTLNLLVRLYEPAQGQIFFGDKDIALLPKALWLGRISMAGQDVELIAGSIAENIRFGCPEASDDALRDVCNTVEILSDIEALPQGFDTSMGAAGAGFSGGQRQRLGLARALIRNPRILILDEAMSALEPQQEDRIWARIRSSMAGRTVIMVNHRADSAQMVDRVVTLGPVQPADWAGLHHGGARY